LVDLVLNGLTTHIKEKLEGYDSVNQVHVIWDAPLSCDAW
jgi:hypothetical protein